MSEMVERVARAICQAQMIDPDKAVHCQGGGILYEWHWWVREARAAMDAMREPTEWMMANLSAREATAYANAIDAALEETPVTTPEKAEAGG